ncbi:GFA family protein [Dyella sp. A6]|uniref:GFA family protein n=1 Tax=Dyella aluminiiresistens TaxID=3069105 RepID=UPI002E788B68|nr:GFA family protein [Dyella sp. A6]
MAMLNCHCSDCQLSSGAPFASGFIVAVAATQVTGVPSSYTVTAASGGKTTRSFCGTCGTPLFAHGETFPVMSIRFPTLDDPTSFKPMLDIWTSRAQPWTCLSPAIPQHERSPSGGA